MTVCNFCHTTALIQVKFFNKELKCGCGYKLQLEHINVCSLDCLRKNGYKTTRMFDFLDIEFDCLSCGSHVMNRIEGDISGL
jgi:hypothetical protein